MSNFAIEKSVLCVVATITPIFDLHIDGRNRIEEEISSLGSNLHKDLRSLVRVLECYANNPNFRSPKIRSIVSVSNLLELKSKNGIRIYIMSRNKKIIVLKFGYKATQKQDIINCRDLIKKL
ncbi:MAG: hypothetical protein ISP71_00740 [Flavobacteriales bacterium]|nr:hypothetical protein [Flavobacteriales bacterium]